jgi:PAS domain S-box-containing protein
MIKAMPSYIKITLIYFLFSILWIYFSDAAINLFIDNLTKLQFWQTIKGGLFVTISSIILYFFSKRQFINLQNEKDELAKTNYLFEKIIENAPSIIFWKDPNGVYLGSNTQFLELMNLENKSDLLGKKDSDFIIKEKENFMSDDMHVMKTRQAKLNYTETITTKNKNIRVLNTSKVPLINESKDVIGILGVIQDITEQTNNQNRIKDQEQLLIQQSKLASMGEMIANIAHQWRQPLSIISTLSTGMKLQKELNMSNEENEKESLDMINENAQYLSRTIDDFKNFFKKSNIKTPVTTNDLLSKTLKLILSRLKARNIEIIQNNENVEFDTYESEMIQVFINIINNAIDAFEKIKTKKYIFIEVKKINNYLIIKIKDNAGGIKNNIIDRIFEPYFSTKDEKQGTGIGLYMCNEIITKHLNGTIQANTTTFNYLDNKYKGTIFTISLPIKIQDK